MARFQGVKFRGGDADDTIPARRDPPRRARISDRGVSGHGRKRERFDYGLIPLSGG